MKLGEFLELRYVTEFKVRDPIWEERRLLDRARGVGRAGDERSARLLPTHPPGHQADPLRLHRAGQEPQPDRGRATSHASPLQLPRADRGAHER